MPDPGRVLVVDDSPSTVEVIRRNLEKRGLAVVTAGDVTEALEILGAAAVDLVITDMKMPGASGLELVHHVRDNYPQTEIVMITGFPSVENAIEAVKGGAEEYLAKPFTDAELFAVVDSALAKLRMRSASAQGSPAEWVFHGLIGASPPMRRLFRSVREAAAGADPVLITGERGTGKTLVARAIHDSCERSVGPFLVVDCGAIPGDRFVGELLGGAAGEGPHAAGPGFFEMAQGGTVFLDEIAEIEPAAQKRLRRHLMGLRGSSAGADIRLLAATDRHPQVLLGSGRLDRELFVILGETTLRVPALRDRGEDIVRLCRYFADKYGAESGARVPHFTRRVLEVLCRYPWPGNVRELERVIRDLVIASGGDAVDTPDLPDGMRFSAARDVGVDRTLAEVEHDFIRQVLARVDGNKSRAARILGIDRKTLRLKLRKMEPQRRGK